jgi:hypothetical protein
MSSTAWAEQKAIFEARRKKIDSKNVMGLLSDLESRKNAGETMADTKVKATFDAINAIKTEYDTLKTDITNYIDESKATTLESVLQNTGFTQQELQRLEEINKRLDNDIETSRARDELLRSGNTKRNSHMLFLLDRPVRNRSIPFLWLASVVFVGVALIMAQMITSTINIPGTVLGYIVYTVTSALQNPVLLQSLLISAVVVIIFLSLKIARVIP